jgi:hypothetical protein
VFFGIAAFALYAAEAGIWFLLVKTYSRGGLVAAFVAMVAFFLTHGKTCMRLARCFWNLAVRAGLVLTMCFAFGFAARLAPSHMTQDRSVLNRIDLWKGALVMTSDSPFRGWGHKLGGMTYINWYQPLEHTTRPVGFVNSYLEVAVEQGSPVLFVAVSCACAMLLVAARLRRACWIAAAGASLISWLASNLWSSLWFWPGLWILPAVAMLCILIAAINIKRDWIMIAVLSTASGLVAWAFVIGAGNMLADAMPFQAKPAANGDAAIVAGRRMREKIPRPNLELWVDASVTGRYWGRTIRTLLGDTACGNLMVYAPWARRSNWIEQPANKRVYSGFQAELSGARDFYKGTIIVIHPTVYPPSEELPNELYSKVTVCLPDVDVSAYNLSWRLWAGKNGARLVLTSQGGTRINPGHDKEFWRSLLFDE